MAAMGVGEEPVEGLYVPERIKQSNQAAERSWKARHDELEEELQQASMMLVELEDELEKKNRLLANHEREIMKMVQQLPPTPAALKQGQRINADEDAGAAFAPGLPIGGLLSGSADGHGADEHKHLRKENERLKSEVRNLLEGAAQDVEESDAGSISSDGSFGTAAVPTAVAGAGHMRAQLEHYKSEVIRLGQKVRSLRNESTYRDKVIVALRESAGETASEASAAETEALRDFASQSTALAEQRAAQVVELQQDLAAAREQQRELESEASAAVRCVRPRRSSTCLDWHDCVYIDFL